MKITEENLLMLTTVEGASRYTVRCEEAYILGKRKTKGCGKTHFSTLFIHQLHDAQDAQDVIAQIQGSNYWCVVIGPAVWAYPEVIQAVWNRMRSRFLGDELLGESPCPKMILTLEG